MGYPKSMYRGSYTPDAINADHLIVRDEGQEDQARVDGFIDGHEFFSKPPKKETKKVK